MGKAGAADKKAASSPDKKAAEAAAQGKETRPALLSQFRPKPRAIFFILYALACTWVLAFYEPCDVKGKKVDCGYSGISAGECRSTACFLKGGGGVAKKVVKVKREEGAALGLKLEAYPPEPELMVVAEVLEGAVRDHNARLPADSKEAIVPGDRVSRVDGVAVKSASKALAKTTAKVVELEIQRSKLPASLDWLRSTKGKPSVLEKLLTAPGSIHFGRSWRITGTAAAACWYASGYPATSLPMYLTLAGVVAFQNTRCCHDDSVPNVPHCYRSKREPIKAVLEKVWAQMSQLAQRVRKDPKAYLKWLFVPEGM